MYESFYKFTGKPFQLLPDANIIFPSSSHKRALSYLLYGIEQGEGFIAITGDVGTGKTTLIQTLFSQIKGDEIVAINIAAANLDDVAIIHSISEALNLRLDGKSKVLIIRELKKYFHSISNQNKRVLIVVDEAQTLSWEALEELRILSNLESGGKALLQVFLVGQTELRNIIHSKNVEQLRQRIIASYNLTHLSKSETKDYIKYRLEKVGWEHNPSISEDIFLTIHDWSEGTPRKINLICDRLFLLGYLEKLSSLELEHLERVITEMDDEIDDGQDAVPKDSQPVKMKKRISNRNQDDLEGRVEDLEDKLEQLRHDFDYERKLVKLLVKNIDFDD